MFDGKLVKKHYPQQLHNRKNCVSLGTKQNEILCLMKGFKTAFKENRKFL